MTHPAIKITILPTSGALAAGTASGQAAPPALVPPAMQQLAGLSLECDAARHAAAVGLKAESSDARRRARSGHDRANGAAIGRVIPALKSGKSVVLANLQ